MHTNRTPNPFTRIAATVAFVFVALAMFTGIAAAETPTPFPEFQIEVPDLEPPPPPPTPVVILPDFELVPLRPTAEAEVNCESGTIDISVGNKTFSHWFIEIVADGEVVGGGPIAPNHAMFEQVELAENDSVDVIVSVLTETTLIDETFTMDCLVPLPDYDIIADCETGQAWARLINHGDDVAFLGVQYPDVMHMEIEVAPHDSEDWLLAVAPGETVEFDIVSSNVSLGSEVLDFTCEAPAPIEPEVDPVDQPAEPQPEDAGQDGDEEQEIEGPAEDTNSGGAGQGPATDAEPTTNADSGGSDGEASDAGEDEFAADQVLAVADGGSNLGLIAALVLSVFGLILLAGAAVAISRGRNQA